ncbi:metallophosphoesterase [Candidatus Woesearchaeota archaeon]|nr:metallophosphoesterase [Candidatus Woesearchaeota archaeon]
MHYAIFSDIQGNYPALEEFFNQVKGRVDRYLCLGDIVQSGTTFDDNRCLDPKRYLPTIWCILQRYLLQR